MRNTRSCAEIASRKHVELIIPVIQSYKDAGITLNDVDAISVTYGPGWSTLVGISVKAIAFSLDKPLIEEPLKAILPPIIANPELEPPFICLEAWRPQPWFMLRDTVILLFFVGRDDAAGEAFDKIARVLGLALWRACN